MQLGDCICGDTMTYYDKYAIYYLLGFKLADFYLAHPFYAIISQTEKPPPSIRSNEYLMFDVIFILSRDLGLLCLEDDV